MRVLICSALSIDKPTAGRNRLMRMCKALAIHGVEATIVGSQAGLGEAWREVQHEGVTFLAFDPKFVKSNAYCKAMQQGAEAAIFYRGALSELTQKYQIQGIIAYSVQAQTVEAIVESARTNDCFVVADMVELFRVNFRYLTNGINYQQFRLLRSVLPKLDGIIGISHGWCDWAKKNGLAHVWCPSFSEDTEFVRANPTKLGQPFVLTVAGHWDSRELPHVFLSAMKICIGLGIDIQMNVVGNTGKTKREQAALRRVKLDPQLNQRVNFLGFVSDSLRDEVFRDTDAFILLRRDTRESKMLFPTRLPEYLVSGNPVVLSNVGCFEKCFRDKHDVCYVPARNRPQDVASVISFLANNPKKRFEIGQRGRQTALDLFSPIRLGDRLAKFLREITETRG